MFFDAYFFDFDGTIGDTESDIRQAWLSALEKHGLPEGDFDKIFRVGPSIQETSAMLFPEETTDFQVMMQNTYKSFYDDGDDYQALPYPGIIELFDQLCRAGKKTYIVTNKRIKPLKKLVDKFGLTGVCHGIFSPDIVDTGNHIKKTELLALALRVSGSSPERSLMIGDTEIDICAGKSCGMKTCAVTWGYRTAEILRQTEPDWLVDSAEQIP